MVDTEQKMVPQDVIRLIKRLRAVGPCKVGVKFDSQMPSDDGKVHAYPTILNNLTLQQATHLLQDMQRIHNTIREVSEDVPLVNVRVHSNDDNRREKSVVLG